MIGIALCITISLTVGFIFGHAAASKVIEDRIFNYLTNNDYPRYLSRVNSRRIVRGREDGL